MSPTPQLGTGELRNLRRTTSQKLASVNRFPTQSTSAEPRRNPAPEDATVDAVVSNLPFGLQFPVEDPARWLKRA